MTRDEWLSVAYSTAKRGNELPYAKLTPELVRYIRSVYRKFCRQNGAPAIAQRLGLHVRTVEKVLTGETWVHVR